MSVHGGAAGEGGLTRQTLLVRVFVSSTSIDVPPSSSGKKPQNSCWKPQELGEVKVVERASVQDAASIPGGSAHFTVASLRC